MSLPIILTIVSKKEKEPQILSIPTSLSITGSFLLLPLRLSGLSFLSLVNIYCKKLGTLGSFLMPMYFCQFTFLSIYLAFFLLLWLDLPYSQPLLWMCAAFCLDCKWAFHLMMLLPLGLLLGFLSCCSFSLPFPSFPQPVSPTTGGDGDLLLIALLRPLSFPFS